MTFNVYVFIFFLFIFFLCPVLFSFFFFFFFFFVISNVVVVAAVLSLIPGLPWNLSINGWRRADVDRKELNPSV